MPKDIMKTEASSAVEIQKIHETANWLSHVREDMDALNAQKEVSSLIPSGLAKTFVERKNPNDAVLEKSQYCFYRISQLSFDKDYPHREAFENVLQAIDNRAYNFVYLLTGHRDGVELDIGVVDNGFPKENVQGSMDSASDYGSNIGRVFEGNFIGSHLERLRTKAIRQSKIFDTSDYECAGVVLGIPSVDKKEGLQNYDFQGIDRLINSMMGTEWRMAIVCEPVSNEGLTRVQGLVYSLYSKLSLFSKQTLSINRGTSESQTSGVSSSDTRGRSQGANSSDSKSFGSDHEKTRSHGTNTGTSESHTEGFSQNGSNGQTASVNLSLDIANKQAQEMMKYIDEELLPRLKAGFTKGMFKTSLHYMAKNPADVERLEGAIRAVFQGDKVSNSPLTGIRFNQDDIKKYGILKGYQNLSISDSTVSNDALILLSRPFNGDLVGLNTYLTTEEISLFAGLPQKEVPGIALKETVDFGLNEKMEKLPEEDRFELGHMVQKGRVLKEAPFYLSHSGLSKHTFVAGVTGSGKTTTCQKLLTEAGTHFLVIEPAKTEYRALLRSEDYQNNLLVLTLGREDVAPFRINPFELLPGEVISVHIDMVKATFTSAFPMEASMPQILEEAIYECYRKKGWNLDTNENEIYGEKAYYRDTDSFPILSDLLGEMKNVVNKKEFGPELRANYIGSLVSRLSNLTVGSKGRMLNCQHSMNFRYLVHHNAVLEMEEMKSPEDKALLMGFILTRLAEVVKKEYENDTHFSHLTLIEEAHRLLSKVEPGDGGARKSAVETFTDLLAEVRKYGEGMIIVDQIPNKLAPEVLKNTNTKIIHKIFAKDDKEAVGDTMMMDDKQKKYLSDLSTGEAIVFSEATSRPVHAKVDAIDVKTDDKPVGNKEVRNVFLKHLDDPDSGTSKLEFLLARYEEPYLQLCKELSKGCYDSGTYQKLAAGISKVADEVKKDRGTVWRDLIECLEHRSGNISTNDAGYEKDLVNEVQGVFLAADKKKAITEDLINLKMLNYFKSLANFANC